MDAALHPLEILKSRRYLVAGLFIVGILLAIEWNHFRSIASAPGMQPIVRTAGERVIRAEGRVVTYPGAAVVIGTEIGGRLRALLVTEKMRVNKGDLLAEIDAEEQRAALAEARRRVAEAEIDIKYLDSELARSQSLFATRAIAAAAVDRSVHERDGARARRDVAAATASRLATVVGKTRVVSPIDGTVVSRLHEPGETLAPGVDLLTIANLDKLRVEAEVDEYDAGHIVLGAPVTVSAEGYGEVTWKGRIEEIPDAVTSRRLKPQDPARPSDTRVLLVKVALDAPAPIKLGQRVEVALQSSVAAAR